MDGYAMSAQELDLDEDSEELDEEQEPVEGDESDDEDDDSLIRSCVRCGVSGPHGGLCQRCAVRGQLFNRVQKKASEPVKEVPKVAKSPSIPVVKVDAPAPAPEPAKPVDSPVMCARCHAKPVGRVVAGCKNNDCCPDCRRKARQSADAKREQRAKKLSHKTAVRKTAPKPVTAPAATPNEMASRMVEAFAIVDAIGWETCRALRARIGGGR